MTLKKYIAEAALANVQPVTGDEFDINIRELTNIETVVVEHTEGSITIALDETAIKLLEDCGCTFEDEEEQVDELAPLIGAVGGALGRGVAAGAGALARGAAKAVTGSGIKTAANKLDKTLFGPKPNEEEYDESLNDIRRLSGMATKKAVKEEGYDKSHGGPYDRGAADSYYGRKSRPHKIVPYAGADGVKGQMQMVPLTDPAEIEAYIAGYNENDDRKDYGFDESKDHREYGYEGEMTMSQLKSIIDHAQKLDSMLEPDTDMPEWVQSKITLAKDYIETAADYLGTQELDEAGQMNAASAIATLNALATGAEEYAPIYGKDRSTMGAFVNKLINELYPVVEFLRSIPGSEEVVDLLGNIREKAKQAELTRDPVQYRTIVSFAGNQLFQARQWIQRHAQEDINEAEYRGRKVKLGKPMQGDVKKFKVYVKDPKTGNVKKVNFGDPNMRIKKSNPARRKSFRARHRCDNPGPRTKARYWSCRKW